MPKSKDCLQDKDFLQYVPTKFQQNRKTMLKKRNRRKSYHQRLARLKNIGGYPEPVQYVDKYYCGFYEIPRKKPYYKRLSAIGMITDFIRDCLTRKFAEY